MKAWVVLFLEDINANIPPIFSTREKAWRYIEHYFDRIYPHGYEDVDWYQEIKASYEECCKNNLDYFVNEYITVTGAIVDEEDR